MRVRRHKVSIYPEAIGENTNVLLICEYVVHFRIDGLLKVARIVYVQDDCVVLNLEFPQCAVVQNSGLIVLIVHHYQFKAVTKFVCFCHNVYVARQHLVAAFLLRK